MVRIFTKRNIKLLFLLTLLILSYFVNAQEKPDEKAKLILDKVSEKYQKQNAFRAFFTYTLKNIQSNINDKLEGEFVMKEDMYRLNLPDQVIINNGKTVWTYLKETNELNITDYEPDDDEITPDKIYNLYKSGFQYNLDSEVTENGKEYAVIDLQPLDKEKQYYKIRVKVNLGSYSVKSWEIFEKNQNRYKYTVTKFQYNLKVSDGYFQFDESAYPDVEVIDLR